MHDPSFKGLRGGGWGGRQLLTLVGFGFGLVFLFFTVHFSHTTLIDLIHVSGCGTELSDKTNIQLMWHWYHVFRLGGLPSPRIRGRMVVHAPSLLL